MKTQRQFLIVALACVAIQTTFAVAPAGPGFTYQGRLNDSGMPASGNYDFSFVLYDAPTNGTPVGNPVYLGPVAVSDGLFTVTINEFNEFGATAFNGAGRWLEIYTRTNNNILGNPFVMLSPRQSVTPAPLATFAVTAGQATTALSANAANAVAWTNVTGVPAGFADGVDNDTTYTAGAGLNFTVASNQFSVAFGGTGVANSAARSDHNHFGASWNGNSSGYGLTVVNSSTTGTGVFAQQGAGSGKSAGVGYKAAVWAEASQGDAVYGACGNASGAGVYGYATASSGANYGVYGQSDSANGVGVFARGSGPSGTALKIHNGAIRVAGAGNNSATPAFVHVVTNPGGYYSVIDNPYCNNDPTAMLFVTPNLGLINPNNKNPNAPQVFVFYDDGSIGAATNRWVLEGYDVFNPVETGAKYNVLIVKP